MAMPMVENIQDGMSYEELMGEIQNRNDHEHPADNKPEPIYPHQGTVLGHEKVPGPYKDEPEVKDNVKEERGERASEKKQLKEQDKSGRAGSTKNRGGKRTDNVKPAR